MTLQVFFGDSHSRQFTGIAGGSLAYYIFSGATLKGLSSPNSRTGHPELIIHALSVNTEKNAFLMFGGVDLDVSLFWELQKENDMSLKSFIASRVTSYRSFVRKITDTTPRLKSVIIIAPQISPLDGEGFIQATADMTGLDVKIIEGISVLRVLDAASRAQLVLDFNDEIQQSVVSEGAKFIRIDNDMIDADRIIKPQFKPMNEREHHAMTGATLNL